MLRTKSKQSYVKNTLKVKHHGRLYFVSKAKLNYILNRIGMRAKFDFINEDLREFLFKSKLLYTEFLLHISDGVKEFDKQ